MLQSTFPYLLSDNESLEGYYRGGLPTFEDVSRSLMLLKRGENRAVPDHHYRIIQQRDLSQLEPGPGIQNIGDLLRVGFFRMAEEHLELRGAEVCVRQSQQNSWQHLITLVPPSVLQAAWLQQRRPLLAISPKELRSYYKDWIIPNFGNTALPPAFIPQLGALTARQGGLHDLHIHLNGATETDVIWQEYLCSPDKVYQDLKLNFNNGAVREQLIQESILLTPIKFYKLLLTARKLRWQLICHLFPNIDSRGVQRSHRRLLQELLDPFSSRDRNSIRHPLAEMLWPGSDMNNGMSAEVLLYVAVFDGLRRHPQSFLANLFHFYLLILGLANRLLVQQTHQYGFEQFQKYTLNGLREYSERAYLNRFVQMQGNYEGYIRFIEGRFSPKDTKAEAVHMIRAIKNGWIRMVTRMRADHLARQPGRASSFLEPELRLIAHFIKRKDDGESDWIRYENLRRSIWKRALVLALLRNDSPHWARNITGVDAAASEFDTPPEVFAPAFRMLRREQVPHFTYHAGEDFYHLLSGLRAIWEAVSFAGLSNGDRIGHATASGLSAEVWARSIGEELLMHRGERLDDLIFVYNFIVSDKVTELLPRLPAVADAIQEHAAIIYGDQVPLHVLIEGWQLRRYCPILARCANAGEARRKSVFDPEAWDELPQNRDTAAWRNFWAYHHRSGRQRYNDIIPVATQGLFDTTDLEVLQKGILAFLHNREIIIETLPTSNVRIGYYKDYSGYHLWNWLEWGEEGFKVPPIVVGTDDTGIFATNIYNEYANIYCFLTRPGRVTHSRAIDFIKKLNENAQIYRFE